MPTAEVKLDFEPYDCTPGDAFDAFEERLFNNLTSSDDRGFSLADHVLGLDEGGPAGPAMPGGAMAAKALAARRKRQKQSYGVLVRHLAGGTSSDHITHMRQNHFQDGLAAYNYLELMCRTAPTQIKLRKLNQDWDTISLLHDIGVNEASVQQLSVRISAVNARRPAANRKTRTEKTERLLECIFDTSKHFSEQAIIEYNAVVGQRQFEHAAGPFVGERDFDGLTAHYHALWSQAVSSKLPGFHVRPPQARGAATTRGTLEQGLSLCELADEEDQPGGLARPRSGSPSRSLALLAEAGDDLASRHGTTTTTDWSYLGSDVAYAAGEDGGVEDEFDTVYLFDADDTASVEIICDCCRGLGHVRNRCPSNRNRSRSLQYAIAALQKKLSRVGSLPPRRPPGRGQRPPFRAQPRRFSQQQQFGRPQQQQFGRRPYRPPRAMAAEEGDDSASQFSSATGSQPAGSSSSSSILGTSELLTATEEGAKSAASKLLTEEVQIAQSSKKVQIAQPLSFSDDQLFESGMVAVETSAPQAVASKRTTLQPAASRRTRPLFRLATAVALIATLIASFCSALTGLLERALAGGTCAVVVLLLLNTPAGDGAPVNWRGEQLLPGVERACISSEYDGRMVIDSGCTSTAIPASRTDWLTRVTNSEPKESIKIGDGKYLPIIAIGEASFPVGGFRLESRSGVPPAQWDEIPCTARLISSRTLVVDGLDESVTLISVRGLKRDAIKTFFNDDNSIQRENCLLLSDQRTVIPFLSTFAYEVGLAKPDAVYTGAEVNTSRRSEKAPLRFHCALGHIGNQRRSVANVVIDGIAMSRLPIHDETSCPGCRLGNTGHALVKQRAPSVSQDRASTSEFSHFGQQVESDICSGFAPSFPHLFTAMLNFVDRAGHESALSFLRAADSSEVCSALQAFVTANEHRLPDGKIGLWKCDNSTTFLSSETQDAATFLVSKRRFAVPYEKNSLAIPERNWGVLERMMRSFLAGAAINTKPGVSTGAPECLWTWAAAQANRLLFYLPTRAHKPPQSPYQWSSGNTEPVDLSWARTMFCDVTVTLPDRDRDGKLSTRSCDGCHLGYDSRRNAHFVYCPSLQRLSSFVVKEWREDSFSICHTISADTPVEYFEASDLSYGPRTGDLLPRRHRAGNAAHSANEQRRIVVLFHRDRPHSLVSMLRNKGHKVISFDIVNSSSQDLSRTEAQHRAYDEIGRANFVFMSPPCSSANIAVTPPWRSFPDHVRGVPGLQVRHQRIVDTHNVLFDFVAECILKCNERSVPWAIESCASRRLHDAAEWPKYSSAAMIWDYPPIARIIAETTATYRCCAQCQWGAPFQKYTGLLTSGGPASKAFDTLFAHGVCNCSSHPRVLQGYDTDGNAYTSAAEEYNPRFSAALTTAIVDTWLSEQEGEINICSEWERGIRKMTHTQLSADASGSLLLAEPPDAPVTSGLTREQIKELHARAHRDRTDVSPDVEIWLQDAEGAYRVAEAGSELGQIKTIDQAKASKHWPLFKAAMESEVQGKMKNGAWQVVERPTDAKVHKSRWVFAAKLKDDNSVKEIKTRFVGCGYSQTEEEYDSVFAATLPGVSLRTLMCFICMLNLETDQIDAVKAFTQADIDKRVYVEMPEGFAVPGCVCLLLKALEGIRQGAYLWFALNRAAWLKLGFTTWINETNLYYHRGLGIHVGIFADDALAGFPLAAKTEYIAIKKEYAKIVNISGANTIAPAVKFVGVQISRDRTARTLTIHNKRYIEQLAIEYKGKFEPQETPFGISKAQRSAFEDLPNRKTSAPVDRRLYLQLVGKLVWPSSMTRPDIAMAMSVLCSCMADPRQEHYDAALVVMGYLISTKELGITYGGPIVTPFGLPEKPPGFDESYGLHCYHDSSWGTQPRPMGGYAIMYCNGALDYGAKAVKIVPASSCEAETAVGSTAAKAMCFTRENLRAQGMKLTGPTPMLGDNKAMYEMIQHEGCSVRTRYYERATLLIKRAVLLLLLAPYLVSTNFMLADIFTKATEKAIFIRMRNRMMNVHSSLRSELMLSLEISHGAVCNSIRRLVGGL